MASGPEIHDRIHQREALADDAIHTLTHYFQKLFIKADLNWDSDNEAEIAGAVTQIIEAART